MPAPRLTSATPPRALLFDADGTLFPSEEPAFTASAEVTNAFLAAYGVGLRLAPDELRIATTGLTFRTTAVALCVAHGVPLAADVPLGAVLPPEYAHRSTVARRGAPTLTRADLEHWIEEERRCVSAYLRSSLEADADVLDTVHALESLLTLGVVTNSARSRLDACLDATGLSSSIPTAHRFSAEDSLPSPRGKPDPAVYTFAAERLGCDPAEALAVEDSVPGARSAVAAGIPTIGLVAFVPPAERAARTASLRAEGVIAVTDSWGRLREVVLTLAGQTPAPAD